MTEIAQPSRPAPSRLRWVQRSLVAWLERIKLLDPWFSLGVAILIGIACGIAAVGFHGLIHAFSKLFWGDGEAALTRFAESPWWMRLLLPALGGLLMSPIIRYLAPEAKGHGVPEVMAAVARQGGVIRLKTGIAKAFASAITIASGGSAGREGPIIQIGGAIGSSVARLLRVHGRRLRIFVGCGAAAGIASTFNAPIAGTLFAVEVILGEFGLLQFSPIVIAAVTATAITRSVWGSDPVFTVPSFAIHHPAELLTYLALGILSGIVSVALIRSITAAETFAERRPHLPFFIKPMAGGLAVGVIACFLPHVMGDGYAVVNLALFDQFPFWMLALLLLAKIAATSFTLGSGGSGGVFMPCLFIGAMAGGLLGYLAQALLGSSIHPGNYALVGMGGLVAGAMHSPITAMIIIFELTGDYSIILPLMVVCITSNLISSKLCRESIYTIKLVQQGIDVFRGRTMDLFHDYTVERCMNREPPRIASDTSAATAIDTLLNSNADHLYTVDPWGRLDGAITLSDLRHAVANRHFLREGVLAHDLAQSSLPLLETRQRLSDALPAFQHAGRDELPVVDSRESRILRGVVRYRDLIALYNEQIILQDSADGILRRAGQTENMNRVAIVEGYSLQEWKPPAAFWDKTLDQLKLPVRYGIYVMLVKTSIPTPQGPPKLLPVIPDRSYRISPEDTLVICGQNQKLDQLPRSESADHTT
ncbi:MAG TPA: chloride channel protein [Kiritimatiellia bacterium]|nr:chloride channel protein [Kiritimatiellia bacterium]